jgi:DNA ligase 1
MAKREFLMLAHPYSPDKCPSIGGWFMSEKLDGIRAFWDGGHTRGMLAANVPFANVEKDFRYIAQPKSTGLWSRYGKTIQAPGWWLDTLPPFPLDGELYMGPGKFQQVASTVKQMEADERWRQVQYRIFDAPAARVVFANGEINTTNFKKKFVGILNFFPNCPDRLSDLRYYKVLEMMREAIKDQPTHALHSQFELSYKESEARIQIRNACDAFVEAGGEGIMLRHPTSFWSPQRSWQLLKFKPYLDDEAEVIGYVWGRETDLGSKLLGMMGALIVMWKGIKFELSGFTDAERQMHYNRNFELAFAEGKAHPGEIARFQFENLSFPIGSKVTFKYRELTDAGVPKEARYWRKFSNS